MDMRKYFVSMPQAALRELLGRKFKDPALLGIFDRILASYHTSYQTALWKEQHKKDEIHAG